MIFGQVAIEDILPETCSGMVQKITRYSKPKTLHAAKIATMSTTPYASFMLSKSLLLMSIHHVFVKEVTAEPYQSAC